MFWRKKQCNCLVMDEWTGSVDPRAWLEVADWFYRYHEREPTDGSVIWADGDSGIVSPGRVHELVDKHADDGINHIGLWQLPKNYRTLVMDWKAVVEMRADITRKALFCVREATPASQAGWMEELVRRCSRFWGLRYGIGYQDKCSRGPALYGFGMAHSRSTPSGGENPFDSVGAWFRETIGEQRYLSGLLRNVYPRNILSETHLSTRVGDATLGEYIERDESHGRLESIADNVWLWTVPEPDVPRIREELGRKGLLIARSPEV